ncbi:MAG TPA: hypothetical protein VGG11_22815 [Xanthobacteraceae bacterium]
MVESKTARSSKHKQAPREVLLNSGEDPFLAGFEYHWKKDKNPIYVWSAIHRSKKIKQPLPKWALIYLYDVAERIDDFWTKDVSDVREVLPGILGFAKRIGPGGHVGKVQELRKREALAMAFAAQIFAGKSPADACADARNSMEYRVKGKSDEPDDRTLEAHLRTIFADDDAPFGRGKRGSDAIKRWQRYLKIWLLRHPLVFVAYRDVHRSFPRTLDFREAGEAAQKFREQLA